MKKVLVLEDESSIRSFVVINLKRSGYEPIEAETGEQAFAAVMIAGDGVDREGADLEQVCDLAETVFIAMIGQIAGQQQHIDRVGCSNQPV